MYSNRLSLLAAFISGIVIALGIVWFTHTDDISVYSEREIYMMADYESPLFREIDPVSAEREWNEYLNSIELPERLGNVKFYELKHGEVHEFHITGYKSDGNHFIAAIPVQKIEE